MTKFALAKTIVSNVVGYSTSFVVANAIRNNVAPQNTQQKVATEVGTFAVGYVAGGYMTQYVDQKIDEAAVWWKNNVVKN